MDELDTWHVLHTRKFAFSNRINTFERTIGGKILTSFAFEFQSSHGRLDIASKVGTTYVGSSMSKFDRGKKKPDDFYRIRRVTRMTRSSYTAERTFQRLEFRECCHGNGPNRPPNGLKMGQTNQTIFYKDV